ncbi:LANO_0F13322g1_1 [Lachancea nothofagi CBS 11611]|uniref:LANO_0F13322g1_1 n=1 Tax=Lachancea nothofagi CBS 11611 TaxID=1266666 RepID=A0A1G4KBP0_9SACH|nr:LANO_0F13322g1_1 [Lachancea nothofagi CBS 11611]
MLRRQGLGKCFIRFQSQFAFKKWADLNLSQKQEFVQGFVENYRKQYPGSKTNVSLKGLSIGMENHGDAPAVFGIFYDDVWGLCKKSKEALYSQEEQIVRRNDIKQTGRFGHESFYDLLVEHEA